LKFTVCGYSGRVQTEIIKDTLKRTTPFVFTYNGKIYAKFDSEDKARIYQDAFQEGVNVGYCLKKEG
jgi:hypothetical protein